MNNFDPIDPSTLADIPDIDDPGSAVLQEWAVRPQFIKNASTEVEPEDVVQYRIPFAIVSPQMPEYIEYVTTPRNVEDFDTEDS